jgi:hypothetical protein
LEHFLELIIRAAGVSEPNFFGVLLAATNGNFTANLVAITTSGKSVRKAGPYSRSTEPSLASAVAARRSGPADHKAIK